LALTANGGRDVFSTSPTACLSWTWPPVIVKFGGRPLLLTTAWIFHGPGAATDADHLLFLSPFPPLPQRCAFTIVLSMKYKPVRDLAARHRDALWWVGFSTGSTKELHIRSYFQRCVGWVTVTG